MTRLFNSIIKILHLLQSQRRHTQGSVGHQRDANEFQAELQLIQATLKQIDAEAQTDRALQKEKFLVERQRLRIEQWTLAIICAGTIGAFLNLWFLKASIDVSRISADAATDSANTARIAMVTSERAYVHISGFRWFSHPDAQGHVFWRIRPQWTNIGHTPTRDLRLDTHYELRDSELPPGYPFVPGERVPATIPPNGTIEPRFFNISGTELLAVMQAKRYLYIWGTATYRDIFPGTKEHITKFLVVASNITGNPLLPFSNPGNPFNIEFVHDRRHDCADEDCDRQDQADDPTVNPK